MRPFVSLSIAVIAIVWSSTASADEQAKSPPPKTAYLSFSPIHLSRPIAELTGEMRVGPKSSIGVVMGAGTIWRQAYWNVGAQFLYYPIGDFERGIQLGLETSYADFAGGLPSNVVTGTVNAVCVAPVVGYKYTFSGGFTISTQAGLSYAPGAERSDRRFSALYNLNVGWSF